MQTSQGYIFCILQHFATKFCNFIDFNTFFTGIYFFSPKLKISLTCKFSNRFYWREILCLFVLFTATYAVPLKMYYLFTDYNDKLNSSCCFN
jgi:hypothetical protein